MDDETRLAAPKGGENCLGQEALTKLKERLENFVRRQKPMSRGIYIEGVVQGVSAAVCVDTGATDTIVSFKVYEKMEEGRRPVLMHSEDFKGPQGERLKARGIAVMQLELGPVRLEHLCVVSDIEDDVLLGDDIMLDDAGGPADLIMSEKKMFLRGKQIPLKLVKSRAIRRVMMASTVTVPPMQEMIVRAYVDESSEAQAKDGSGILVEMDQRFVKRHGCVLAPVIVGEETGPTIPVRLMNPKSEPVKIHQETVVGSAETAEVVGVIAESEDPEEDNNLQSCRRIILGKRSDAVPVVGGTIRRLLTEIGQVALPSHVQGLYDTCAIGRTHEEEQQIKALLLKHEGLFSKNEYDLGRTHLVEHHINTGNALPIKQPPRRMPLAFANEDRKALEKLGKQKVIRPSTSPWASPMVMVRKKDGTVRPCVDYRRVNAVTVNDAFPIPRTQDCLVALAGATVFSTMDITSAYNQVPVAEQDIPKTAFVTKYGIFEFLYMPFGLMTAPATFQRLMELALAGMQWSLCLIYLDDVIVFGRDFDEHVDRLDKVLTRIGLAGLKLKPGKCNLFAEEVTFLGHVVSKEGVLPNPDNVAKIVSWPVPRNVREVRGFLGLGNYYRRFVKNFSKRSRAMAALLQKDKKFEWTEECQKEFDDLRAVLTGPEVMAFPTDDGEYLLDTDASDDTIGAVLSQEQDGVMRVIAYGSRSLGKAERNYCATDRELLAAKYFMEYYRHYLLGRRFTLRSDHEALKWLFSLKEPRHRMARWIEVLGNFQYQIEYRPGKRHGNADALSRCPGPQDCDCVTAKEAELPCRTCRKCLRKAELMMGTLPGQETSMVEGRALRMRAEEPSPLEGTPYPEVGRGYADEGADSTIDDDSGQADEEAIRNDASPGAQGRPYRLRPRKKLAQPKRFAVESGNHTPRRRLKTGRGSKRRAEPEQGWCLAYNPAVLRERQLKDPDVGPVLRWKESGTRPPGCEVSYCSPATRLYWNNWDVLEMRDGVLFRSFWKKDMTGKHVQLVVPRCLKEEVLQQVHDAPLSGGHLGQKKTRGKATQRFFWFGMREDCRNWVSKCDVCARIKHPVQRPHAPLGQMPVGAPLDRLATDILGPLPESARGNKYILAVTDYFTKWVEIFAVPDQSAATCAGKILNEVIARFGCPYDLHSDQGRNYESALFAELCRLLEIRKTRTTPYHPSGNGQVERFNRTLVAMIKSYLAGEQHEWDRHLGCLAAAYRATPHETTGMTPNLLMLGREVRLPVEVVLGVGNTARAEEVTSYGEYVDGLRTHMQRAHDVAREHLGKKAVRAKETYDAKKSLLKYRRGDLILYATQAGQQHLAPKLRSPYEGPYLVVEKLSDLAYRIQLDARGKQKAVHHDKLKPYEGRITLPWAKSALRKHVVKHANVAGQ